MFDRLQSFRFLLVRKPKAPSVISSSWKRRHFTSAFLTDVKPLTIASELLKLCRSPWLDVFVCALIPVEHILSMWCDLCLDKSKELEIYKILNIYIKFK